MCGISLYIININTNTNLSAKAKCIKNISKYLAHSPFIFYVTVYLYKCSCTGFFDDVAYALNDRYDI